MQSGGQASGAGNGWRSGSQKALEQYDEAALRMERYRRLRRQTDLHLARAALHAGRVLEGLAPANDTEADRG